MPKNKKTPPDEKAQLVDKIPGHATRKQFKDIGYDMVDLVNKHVRAGLPGQQVEDVILHILISNMAGERCPHCLMLDVAKILEINGVEGIKISEITASGDNGEHVH